MELCGEILSNSHPPDILHAVLHLYNKVIIVVKVEGAIVFYACPSLHVLV